MQDAFLKHVAHPAVNLVTGFQSELGELNRLQWDSHEKIERRVLKRVRLIAAHAYENFRFYRERFDLAKIHPASISTLEDLQRIPTITKGELSEHLQRERGLKRFAGILTTTGGTTGKPLTFLSDQNASTAGLVSKIFFDSLAEASAYERKAGIHRMHGRRYLKDRIFLNEIQVSYTSLLKDPEATCERILRFKPKLVGSSASLILADFMLKSGRTAGDWLKAVVTWGFPVLREQIGSISEAFCSNIYDRYGSAELGWGHVAQQCNEKTGLHVNTEVSLIEVVRNGEPCSEGERGRLVITNLRNFATPFIRYEQGDTAVRMTDCACGRNLPQIARVEGKDSSLVEMKGGVHIPVAVLHSIVRSFREAEYIERVSFRKTSSNTLVLTIVPEMDLTLESLTRFNRN